MKTLWAVHYKTNNDKPQELNRTFDDVLQFNEFLRAAKGVEAKMVITDLRVCVLIVPEIVQ